MKQRFRYFTLPQLFCYPAILYIKVWKSSTTKSGMSEVNDKRLKVILHKNS